MVIGVKVCTILIRWVGSTIRKCFSNFIQHEFMFLFFSSQWVCWRWVSLQCLYRKPRGFSLLQLQCHLNLLIPNHNPVLSLQNPRFPLPPQNTHRKVPCHPLHLSHLPKNLPHAQAHHPSPKPPPHPRCPSPRALQLPPLPFHQEFQGFTTRLHPPSEACLPQHCPRMSHPGWPWPRRRPKPGVRCPRLSSDRYKLQ